MITLESIIARLQPYPRALKDIIDGNPVFAKALKHSNPTRFIALGAVITSHSRLVPEDQIIGFIVYDSKTGIFKQDFIVNIGNRHEDYILYTRFKGGDRDSKVKDISKFFEKYSDGTLYGGSHHIKFEDIPDEIKPRALEAVELSKKLKLTGLRKFTQKELDKFDVELKKLNL